MDLKPDQTNPRERLLYLVDCLKNTNIEGIGQSFQSLMQEALNNNPEAIKLLLEFSEHFSNINISFNKLADFIDRKFNHQ